MTLPRLLPLAAIVAGILVAGCDKPARQDAPQPAASPSVAALPPPAASPAPAAASAPEVAAPSLATMFEGSPAPDTRRSETVTAAGGVYAGLPPEWSTQDVYNAYLIASTAEAKAMVYLVVGSKVDPAALDSFAKSASYPIYLKDLTWDSEWTDAKIGPSGYSAKVRRGHGMSIFSDKTRRSAIAVGVEVPGRKPIFILGSWNVPSEVVERQFVDLVRGVGRCKHKPNRGCVPVMPTGGEDELPTPPKSGPGSSPFG